MRLVHRQLDRISDHPKDHLLRLGGSSTHPVLEAVLRENDLNSVTGKIVLVHSDFTERFNFQTGTTTYTGQIDMGVGPGHTRFIHDTGLLIFDADANIIKVAGPHTVQFGGNAPYCQALS